jgi:hypothetical protein
MKTRTAWMLALLIVNVCAASLTITQRSIEKKDKESGDASRIQIFSRGTREILIERRSKERLVSRTYTVQGASRISEIDTNGDGVIDLLVFYDQSGDVIEAFEENGGNVVPVSPKRLTEMKNDSERWKGYWQKALPAK